MMFKILIGILVSVRVLISTFPTLTRFKILRSNPMILIKENDLPDDVVQSLGEVS